MQRKDQVSRYIVAHMQEHYKAKYKLGMNTWKELSDSRNPVPCYCITFSPSSCLRMLQNVTKYMLQNEYYKKKIEYLTLGMLLFKLKLHFPHSHLEPFILLGAFS